MGDSTAARGVDRRHGTPRGMADGLPAHDLAAAREPVPARQQSVPVPVQGPVAAPVAAPVQGPVAAPAPVAARQPWLTASQPPPLPASQQSVPVPVPGPVAAPVAAGGGVCAWSWLGRVAYGEGLALQQSLAGERRSGRGEDRLLLLEHPHVYTLGRQAKASDLLWDAAERARRGVEVHAIDRGGEITYHGPGQLVGYPILDLGGHGRDLHLYVRRLEETLILALRGWGIAAERAPGLPGVWAGRDKIAAIGVHVARWVSTHGFALNVDPDLSYFEGIVPCGIRDRGVTSVRALTGRAPALPAAARDVAAAFGAVFGVAMRASAGG